MRVHLRVMTRLFTAAMMVLSMGQVSQAEPFVDCPSKAFLFQSNNVQVYGINLISGSYQLLESYVGISGNINGVGFNFDDRYLYGFNTTTYTVVKLGRDYQAETLAVSGLPAETTFYVGDVSDNIYWVYRRNTGLYRINLDATANDYLQAVKIDGAPVSVRLTDFAFHPGNGELYGVDNSTGVLYRFDTQTGAETALGNTGVTGTFGAGYFDVDGNYYISRNQDGQIFRININDPESVDPTAQFFAQGPFSNQNDGARCAFAPLATENVDWGDAPDSYQTSLQAGGARHELSETLYLGAEMPDGEADGYPYPNADDDLLYDDEDAYIPVRDFYVGLDGMMDITVFGYGYLQAWIDWNGDGDFADVDEQVSKDLAVETGTIRIPINVPSFAVSGDTWLRLRLTSQTGISFSGGAADGEVEDHMLNILPTSLSYSYYPSQQGWVTLAYEDAWPVLGDYDLNDVVLRYRTVQVWDNQTLKRIDIHGELTALGASYHNGFAVHFPNVLAQWVDTGLLNIRRNERHLHENFTEDQSELVALISEDLTDDVVTSCPYYRTQSNCQEDVSFTFEARMSFLPTVDSSVIPAAPFNPFIFASPNRWHGAIVDGMIKRSVEIHLTDYPPTDLASSELWQLSADDSDPNTGRYYRTATNLPWALLINSDWQHPIEGLDILNAYPEFSVWVESNGVDATDWHVSDKALIHYLY